MACRADIKNKILRYMNTIDFRTRLRNKVKIVPSMACSQKLKVQKLTGHEHYGLQSRHQKLNSEVHEHYGFLNQVAQQNQNCFQYCLESQNMCNHKRETHEYHFCTRECVEGMSQTNGSKLFEPDF